MKGPTLAFARHPDDEGDFGRTAVRGAGVPSPSRNKPARTRRRLFLATALVMTTGLGSCQPSSSSADSEDKPMNKDGKEVVYFDVSANSYYGRPIFDIMLNGVEIGVGGGGLMTGVAVPLGPQVITWRLDGPEGMPGNGDTVKAVNQPTLARPDQKLGYLGVHIYPDNTVELVPSEFWPEVTDRGLESIRLREQKNGK